MKILLVSATTFEIAPLIQHLDKEWEKASFFEYQKNGHSLTPLVTGVGLVNTAMNLSRSRDLNTYDLAINIGVCGTSSPHIKIGDVVEVIKDKFGDIGVEDADGSFSDLADLELESHQVFPYQEGWLTQDKRKYETDLPQVKGLTVAMVTGTEHTADKRKSKYNADVETMEGAAFISVCKQADLSFVCIRGVSNFVGKRDKSTWQLAKSIDASNIKTIEFLDKVLA